MILSCCLVVLRHWVSLSISAGKEVNFRRKPLDKGKNLLKGIF